MFFLKGLSIGFAIAAPVGPIGVLCLRRSLKAGFWIGLATGLGAATADAAYGCVAAFGLTAVSNVLVGQKFWFGLVGGVFLCYLGIRSFMAEPGVQPATASGAGPGSACISTLFLTLTNPMTILSFVAIFAGFGLGAAKDYGASTTMVLGVFLGSALWWLLLSGAATLLRSRITLPWMQAVNRLSGIIIFGFGVYSLSRVSLK